MFRSFTLSSMVIHQLLLVTCLLILIQLLFKLEICVEEPILVINKDNRDVLSKRLRHLKSCDSFIYNPYDYVPLLIINVYNL